MTVQPIVWLLLIILIIIVGYLLLDSLRKPCQSLLIDSDLQINEVNSKDKSEKKKQN